MRLDQLIAAAAAAQEVESSTNHAMLLYGAAKTGKTAFVGTAASIPEVDRIFWFDLENGWETLAHMDLTPEQQAKINLYRIRDTRRNPVALETMLRALCGGKAVNLCEMHGKDNCAECKQAKRPFNPFELSKCTNRDLVVIDSGSQLGNSALSAAVLGKDSAYKPTFDDYGMVRFWLVDILSVIQQCQHTNFIMITHELIDEEEHNGRKSDRIFPLVGTRAFCREVSKYFGTVAYFHLKLGKHAVGSSSTYRTDTACGSRLDIKLEDCKEPSMRDLLIAGNILRPLAHKEEASFTAASTQPAAPAKPSSVAAMLASKQAAKTAS